MTRADRIAYQSMLSYFLARGEFAEPAVTFITQCARLGVLCHN